MHSLPHIELRPPTPEELRAAPFLFDWALVLGTTGVRLTGNVRGHPKGPLSGSVTIITSEFVDIDPDLAWARTESRYYRLGSQQDAGAYALALTSKWQRARAHIGKPERTLPEGWEKDWEEGTKAYAQWLKDNNVTSY